MFSCCRFIFDQAYLYICFSFQAKSRSQILLLSCLYSMVNIFTYEWQSSDHKRFLTLKLMSKFTLMFIKFRGKLCNVTTTWPYIILEELVNQACYLNPSIFLDKEMKDLDTLYSRKTAFNLFVLARMCCRVSLFFTNTITDRISHTILFLWQFDIFSSYRNYFNLHSSIRKQSL